MYKYLLIGGNGFIGTNIIYKLLEKKRDIFCIDLYDSNTKKIDDKHFNSFINDLSNTELVKELVDASDIIIYLASVSNVRNSSNDSLIELGNIENFINFLEIVKEYENKKVVLASSGGAIYGETKDPVNENHTLMPISPYGIGKLSMENFLRYYNLKYGIKYVICRYSNPYGQYQNPFSGVGVINKLLYNYHTGNETKIIGNPDGSVRDYIYISDLVDATIKVSENKFADNNVFNIGSGVGYSLTQILNEIESVLEDTLRIKKGDFGMENVSKIVLDISKINEKVEWSPKISLRDGIIRNNEWIKFYLNVEESKMASPKVGNYFKQQID